MTLSHYSDPSAPLPRKLCGCGNTKPCDDCELPADDDMRRTA